MPRFPPHTDRLAALHPAGLRRVEPPGGDDPLERLERSASRLRVSFQPIADLRRAGVVAYEALLAAPGDAPCSPAAWSRFGLAPHAGAVEARVLEVALPARLVLPQGAVLVLTVSAAALVTAPVQQVLAGLGSLDRIHLSVAEGAEPVEPFAVAAALEAGRGDGLRVVAEACGAGADDLDRLVHLRPDAIRAGGRLVDGVHLDPAKASAICALVALAGRIDAEVLATGVETEADLRELAGLGVAYVTGPVVAPADERMRPLGPAVEALVATLASAGPADPTVAGLVESPAALPVATPLSELVDALLEDPRNDYLALVDGDHRPVALVERAGVLRAEPYERPVMWVLPDSGLAAVARRAMERPPLERFAPLVCCDAGGRYVGLVHVERLVSALAR